MLLIKAKLNQNQNEKWMFENDSFNKVTSKTIKTPIKWKADYNINQSRNKSKKFWKNLDNGVRQKLCETAEKRMRTICKNLNDETKKKLLKSDQKKKKKKFMKIQMMKQK